MIASLCRTVPILCLVFVLIPQTLCGQVKPKATGKVTIRGQIVPHPEFQQAWTGERLEMAPAEMTARLREYVDLPLPPLPAGFDTWPAARQQEWEAEFIASEAGQQHLKRNEALLAAALSLDIKFEQDGSFVIFDVPPGEYAIQGRKDKTIGEYTYAFEVFGQLTIQSDVELVKLAPMVIDVTPLLAPGQSAPPLEVEGIKVQPDRPLLLNFWSRQGPLVLDQQRQIQETAAAFSKSGLTLVSINIDDDAASARKLAQERQWKLGQQAPYHYHPQRDTRPDR